jgi:hypothetical protein
VGCIAKAGRLASLARDVFEVLVDLGMPPIQGIPQDPGMTSDIFEVVGVILEHLQEAYASNHGSRDKALFVFHRRLHPSSCTHFCFSYFISRM